MSPPKPKLRCDNVPREFDTPIILHDLELEEMGIETDMFFFFIVTL
jgi:hypothetical protein